MKENNTKFRIKAIVILIIVYIIISLIFYPIYSFNNCIKNFEMDKRWEIMKIKGMSDNELKEKYPLINTTAMSEEFRNKLIDDISANYMSVIDSEMLCKIKSKNIPFYMKLIWYKDSSYRPPG